MDFKKELAAELNLGNIAEATMLDMYWQACEKVAKKYHKEQLRSMLLSWTFLRKDNMGDLPTDRDFEVLFDNGIVTNFYDENHPMAEIVAWREKQPAE